MRELVKMLCTEWRKAYLTFLLFMALFLGGYWVIFWLIDYQPKTGNIINMGIIFVIAHIVFIGIMCEEDMKKTKDQQIK